MSLKTYIFSFVFIPEQRRINFFTCILCPSTKTKVYQSENSLREHVGRRHWDKLLEMTNNSIDTNFYKSLVYTVSLECRICTNKQVEFQSEIGLRQHIVCSHINLQCIAKEHFKPAELPLLDGFGNPLSASDSGAVSIADDVTLAPESSKTTPSQVYGNSPIEKENDTLEQISSTTSAPPASILHEWFLIIDRIRCEQCTDNRTYKNQKAYEQHLHSTHGLENETKKNKVYCGVCRKGLKGEEALKVHMEVKHSDRASNSESVVEVFSCAYCTRCDFSSENSLAIHIEVEHPSEYDNWMEEKCAVQ